MTMLRLMTLVALAASAAAQFDVSPYCPDQVTQPTMVTGNCATSCMITCGPTTHSPQSRCTFTVNMDGSSKVACTGTANTIAPFCPPGFDSPGPSSTTPCGDGCSFMCTGSMGTRTCSLKLDAASNRWGVSCGVMAPAGPPTIAPFCPGSGTPSSSTPCGDGCQYTCSGIAGTCRLTFLTATSQFQVNCGASPTAPSPAVPSSPTPASVRMIQPFCPTETDQPSSTAPCLETSPCSYTCAGQACTLTFSGSWSVRCGGGGGVPATMTAAPVAPSTGAAQPTQAPPAGEAPCPANTQCAQMLPSCETRYCGCTNGQLTRYFCNAGSMSTPSPPFVAPPTTVAVFFPDTAPPTFTQPNVVMQSCDVASLCDSYPSTPSCTVATGARCICNAQQQVVSKSCGAQSKMCVMTTAATRACDQATTMDGKQCKTSTGAQCMCDTANNVVSKVCIAPGGGATAESKCSAESEQACVDGCGMKTPTCNCNADGTLKGFVCGATSLATATAALAIALLGMAM